MRAVLEQGHSRRKIRCFHLYSPARSVGFDGSATGRKAGGQPTS